MRYMLFGLFLALFVVSIVNAEYVERVDGGGIIGEVNIVGNSVTIEDWDGKKYTFYRDYIRRIRSQDTGKFATYTSKSNFDIYTDARPEFASSLGADLDYFQDYLNKNFGFKKPPKERITIRVFSSTRDYENHWDNRYKASPQSKRTLAFYDPSFKDVSSVYAGRETFKIIAPRVAAVYLMRLYPKTIATNQLWLTDGWYGLFENVRIENGQLDMLGLDIDALEDLQKFLESKPFSLDQLFSFKLAGNVKKNEYDNFKRQAVGFLHYIVSNKKIGLKFASFLDRIEEYAEPMVAFNDKIEKKTELFENDVRKWVQAFSDESPWRIYYNAEREFLRKKNSQALKLIASGLEKYPAFENFLRLRAMLYITTKDHDEALEDVVQLEKNPSNAEMCAYFRALILLREKEFKKAATIFRELIAKDSGYYRCLEQLLNIYWSQDANYVTDEEANSFVETIKEAEPYSYTFILEAKVLMKQGKYEEARVPLSKAQRRDPENPEIEELMKIRRKMAQDANK